MKQGGAINTGLRKQRLLSLISGQDLAYANFLILVLLLIGAVFVYQFDFPFSNTIFYFAIFILFIISDKNIFWTAFLIILIYNPWGLFYYKYYDWILPITPTVSIPFTSIYGIAFLLKAWLLKGRRGFYLKDYFKSYYRFFGFYAVFLFCLNFVFGQSLASVFKMLVFLPSFLLFYSIPRLFSFTELVKLNKIIFLFVIIHSFGIFFDIVFNGLFINLITFNKVPTSVGVTEDLIRLLGGIGLNLYTMVTGMFYILSKEKSFKKWYLWFVVIIAYVTILSSATRGWMIASTVFFLLTLLYSIYRRYTSFKSITTLIIVAFMIMVLMPRGVLDNLDSAYDRLRTVESMAEGDLSAEGTAKRFTERGPRVLSRFNESPVFGFGYSKITEDYYDGHVGNHSLLLMGGIIGFIIVWLSIILAVIRFFQISKYRISRASFVFGFALLAIMIIHSTSRVMVSFYFPADSALLIAMFFGHTNASLQRARARFSLNQAYDI